MLTFTIHKAITSQNGTAEATGEHIYPRDNRLKMLLPKEQQKIWEGPGVTKNLL